MVKAACLVTAMVVAMVAAPAMAIPTTGMTLWLKADSLSLANGAPVTSWPDSSPLGNSATPSASAPTYQTGVINGKPVVRFLGSNAQPPQQQYFTVPSASMGSTSGTMFVVTAPATSDGNSTPYDGAWVSRGRATDNGSLLNWCRREGLENFGYQSPGPGYLGARSNVRPLWAANQAIVLADSYDFSGPLSATTFRLYFNSPTALSAGWYGSGTVSPFEANGPTYIGRAEGAVEGTVFTGDIAGILIYDHLLTSGELNAVGYYLGTKYGIQTTFTPEPATLALLTLGSLGMLRRRHC